MTTVSAVAAAAAPVAPPRSALLARVAAAPISWGVCEVPGWGHQLDAEHVLAEMASLGFTRTELGPAGFLPSAAAERRALLDRHGLSVLGGFVPFVLHDPGRYDETRRQAVAAAEVLADAGATFFVSCAVADLDDWHRPELTDDQWRHLYYAVDDLQSLAAEAGLTQAFHPHVNSIVEQADEVEAVLANTTASIALDTAHLTLGGTDPCDLVARHLDRIALVHLKDVDAGLARAFAAGETDFMAAVARGLFPPLGRGSVDIAALVAELEASGRDFWYTLEQDAALADAESGTTAALACSVAASLEYLESLAPPPAASVSQ
ncbi:MAG TPA: inosose dehydratase [Acidimicrobiaceae bacterium]|nr:inosose dehydratase [Acidimicrobiaceae bacterium]